MALHRDIYDSDVSPDLTSSLERIKADLEGQGFTVRIHEVLRTPERGQELQDRGLSLVGPRSEHCKGRAADIVDGSIIGGLQVWWGASLDRMSPAIKKARKEQAERFFAALGESAQRHGLVWGGRWTKLPDPAHVELPR